MSDESNPKNIASVWILAVLVGGLSVPFWRWDDSSNKRSETLQWVDPNSNPNGEASAPQVTTQHSLVSATSNAHSDKATELLQEFANSDPGLQIQDAVKENQQRPGIPKQFQGEGIPLTEIKPWLPKPIGYDATPTDNQKIAGTVNGPIPAPTASTNSNTPSNQITPSTSPWPDQGYQAGDNPIPTPTMYYSAAPSSSTPSRSNSPESGPGKMVSSSHSTPSDPPALSNAFPAASDQNSGMESQPRSATPVTVTPSPAVTPPPNPLRSGTTPSAAPARRPGTIISQPKPAREP
jgi:hypothetical protein